MDKRKTSLDAGLRSLILASLRESTVARPSTEPDSVAVVHDYLNQCGGAERVALELARMWPRAPVYTSLYRHSSTFAGFAEHDVRPSPLDRLPVDTHFRALAPLYPLAFRSFGALSEELVISSSSGWAHGVRTSPESLHVVYCHTPARWLYRSDDHLGRSFGRLLLSPLAGPLRRWDRAAARRADVYVASCEHVRRRIRTVYGRETEIVHPPVDVERYAPGERGERLLVISRLLPYKRVDLIVRAATRAGLGLDVVGPGPSIGALRALAGPTVTFHGRVDDDTLKELLERCRALCVAATEDFGIAPIEAGAAGKPVVAYAAGGALETLIDGVNAVMFHELTEDALLEAITRADELDTSPAEIAALSRRFSAEAFRARLRALIGDALAQRRSAGTGGVA
jgi:glycosyltransferase involved in cell wall biosynthesis